MGLEMLEERTAAPRRQNLSPIIGLALIACGVVLSVTVLEWAVYPSGTIPVGSRRAIALMTFRVALCAIGAYLLVRRPRVTSVHLTLLLLAGAIAALVGASLLQAFYTPPPIVSGWRSRETPAELNELGFRGRRIDYSPQDFVVVLLGDSHVEARSLPFDAIPANRLQAHLKTFNERVKVFSLGTGGYGQDQEFLVLEEYFQKYRADMVILWQEPRNDVWNNMFRTHMFGRDPKPTFWLDAEGLQGPTERMGEPLGQSRLVVAAMWQRMVSLPRRDKRWEDQLPPAYVPLDRADAAAKTTWQERWDGNIGSMRDENLATEKSHMLMMLTPPSQRAEYGLELTRALLGRIRVVAQTAGAAFVILDVKHDLMTSDDDGVYVLHGKYYRVSKRQFDANVEYLDGGFRTEAVPVTVADWKVSPEDAHYNAVATDQLMRDLASRLKDLVAHPRD